MNPPQRRPDRDPDAAAQRQLRDALTVMATALEIRVAADALARDPLSEPTAERLRALLADPGLRCARAAMSHLLATHPAGTTTVGRF